MGSLWAIRQSWHIFRLERIDAGADKFYHDFNLARVIDFQIKNSVLKTKFVERQAEGTRYLEHLIHFTKFCERSRTSYQETHFNWHAS